MSTMLRLPSRRTDEEAVQRAQQLMGVGGLLDEPAEVLLAPHDIPVFLYAAQGHLPALHPACPAPEVIHGAGCGLTRSAALASACGEVIERAGAWRCCVPEAIVASYDALREPAVDPRRFALYTAEQYAHPGFHFQRLETTSVLPWVEGWSWTQQRTTLLPTAFVYQSPCRGTGCVFHTVSTGLACHTDPAHARLSGFCEVIERDAMMIAWLNGLELPRIRPPAHDPVLQELYRRIADKHMRATVLDATTDVGMPVRIALLETGDTPPTACAIGTAARPDPVQAHRKALLEAVHTMDWLHQMQQRRLPLEARPPTWVPATFADHVFLYGHDWATPALDVWHAGPWHDEGHVPCAPESPEQTFTRFVQQLADLQLEVLTVDVTLPDAAEVGFCVIRTVVPGMIPLTMGRDACLGGTRLYTVPAHLGWSARYGPQQWQPAPHPFP